MDNFIDNITSLVANPPRDAADAAWAQVEITYGQQTQQYKNAFYHAYASAWMTTEGWPALKLGGLREINTISDSGSPSQDIFKDFFNNAIGVQIAQRYEEYGYSSDQLWLAVFDAVRGGELIIFEGDGQDSRLSDDIVYLSAASRVH